MAFHHASAPIGMRTDLVLSADNAKPDRFTLMETLRRAAPALPFGPPVIATIDAFLSCLPPKRNHDMVFASNATLVLRRNGISERTLRRHVAELVAAGLLVRIDSPNGKRYAKRDTEHGQVLRFGLDLAPLFRAFERLSLLAAEQAAITERIDYLRTKLRALIQRRVRLQGDEPATRAASQVLRRKLAVPELENLIAQFAAHEDELCERVGDQDTRTTEMSTSNGQNVRHQQNSEKELIDKEKTNSTLSAETIALEELVQACPQACEFLTEPPRTRRDVVAHARRLAPMIGIDQNCYEAAEVRLGAFGTAITIWGILEMLGRIQQPGAYFRTLTSGRRSAEFEPGALIQRLLRFAQKNVIRCPRTISNSAGKEAPA